MMETTTVLRDQLIRMYDNLLVSITDAAPRVLTGIVLVILALVGAKIIARILRSVLTRIRFDALLEKLGVTALMTRLGIAQAPSLFLPRVAYYLLLFLFAQAAADAMGLTAISTAIGGFLAYLPNVAAALIVLIFGSLAGQYAGSMVARAAREAGVDFASPLGNVVSGLVVFIAAIMAISQLKIDTDIIRIVTVCVLAGFALAFGLSFGMGSREITRNMMAGFYAKRIFRPGARVELRGERGVLTAITPVQTVVQAEDRTVAVANSTFLDEVVRQEGGDDS
jgi:hypothetical protein